MPDGARKNCRDMANGVPRCSVISRPGFALLVRWKSARGTRRTIAGTRLTGAMIVRVIGSHAIPPQCSPPSCREPPGCRDAGWRERALVTQGAKRRETGLAVLRRRAPDIPFADLLWNQCCRLVWERLRRRSISPVTSLAGTERSRIGKIGRPVRRSKRKRWPVFEPTATAAPSFPGKSSGGDATS